MKLRLLPSRGACRRAIYFASILLLVLIVAGWIRSRFVYESYLHNTYAVDQRTDIRNVLIAHSCGEVVIYLREMDLLAPVNYSRLPKSIVWRQTPVRLEFSREVQIGLFGYGWLHRDEKVYGVRQRLYGIFLPYWLLFTLSSIAPALWTIAWWRRRRQNNRRTAGLCPHCGYDLRASPERCPECGTLTPPAASATREPV